MSFLPWLLCYEQGGSFQKPASLWIGLSICPGTWQGFGQVESDAIILPFSKISVQRLGCTARDSQLLRVPASEH